MFSRKVLFYGLAGLALCALCALDASAGKGNGKGNGGGGGGDPPPAGTLYYDSGGLEWSMDSDGSNKTSLPVKGEPSHDLHGGQRWFLQNRAVGGEGTQVFAVRGDGNESYTVRLTTNPDLRKDPWVGLARWSKDDGSVSWSANRWDAGAAVQSGIYVAGIDFDVAGNVVGLDAQPDPFSPAISLRFNSDGSNHDWAPDGTKIVYENAPDSELHIADLVGGGTTFLASGIQPAWSPDGGTIVFQQWSGINTISPDGSGQTLIIKSSNKGRNRTFVALPRWAPTSSHLIYLSAPSDLDSPDPGNVWRAAADGSGKTNLTGDLDVDASPMAWR